MRAIIALVFLGFSACYAGPYYNDPWQVIHPDAWGIQNQLLMNQIDQANTARWENQERMIRW